MTNTTRGNALVKGFIRSGYRSSQFKQANALAAVPPYITGDIIKTRIDVLGLTYHFGVYCGEYKGVPRVFDIDTYSKGERAIYQLVSLDKFENGKGSELASRVSQPADIQKIGERMEELLNRGEDPYDVLGEYGWNCEQVAYYVVTGKDVSHQARAVGPAIRNGKITALIGLVATVAITWASYSMHRNGPQEL